MDYFVSVESGAYHQWQLELLIESFRLKGLESQLVIAVANGEKPFAINSYLSSENIRSVERIFSHMNYGREQGLPHLNKTWGLISALKSGMLKSPFVVLEPDMMLVSPIDEMKSNIQFHTSNSFPRSLVEEHIPLADFIGGEWEYMPIGSVYAFKDVETIFFDKVLSWQKRLLEHTSWKESTRVGWMLGFFEGLGNYSLQGSNHYEGHLLENKLDFHFIHYAHGVPPRFSKSLYRSSGDMFLAECTPYELLLKVNPTVVTNYAQEIVRSYLRRVFDE